MARDAAAALTFYGKALGFRHEVSETRDNFTYYLLQTDRPRAGLFLSPWTTGDVGVAAVRAGRGSGGDGDAGRGTGRDDRRRAAA